MKDTNGLKAFVEILPFLPYALFSLGIIMGWRYKQTDLVFSCFVLALSYLVLYDFGSTISGSGRVGPSTREAVVFLLPINLFFFTILSRRRLFTSAGLITIVLLLFQVLGVFLFLYPLDFPRSGLIIKLNQMFPTIMKGLAILSASPAAFLKEQAFLGFKTISLPSALSFLAVLTILFIRFLRNRNIIVAGFFSTLAATLPGILAVEAVPSLSVYFFAAGAILIITCIEWSFSMAYIDELTGLNGRRSLNEALLNLGKKYAVAMIDIDHFKKFNDRYGHKTGDQVLKMVAAKLREMEGGAKTFRYGGEEFTALFPGKSLEEALLYADKYRRLIAATPFMVRGKKRKKSSSENRGKEKLSETKRAKVTVSIGVAAPTEASTTPEMVLKVADKALYKAKKAGRNRVKGA
jgi:diguanylate cyclase (GGDEF)-like protein